MSESNNFFRSIATLIEAGVISSKELKKELNTTLKFRRDDLVNKLGLVTQEEFDIQNKIIQKLLKEVEILKKSKKKKNIKKAKKP
tara:strand:- start:123 stop:377 length:255 start_codon:yes stop_codon:yes gene_type:complete